MKRFSELVVRLRWPILLLAAVATALGGWQLRNVRIESDIVNYLPQGDPAVVSFRQIGEDFGNNHIAMVAVELDDVFSTAGLELVRDLTQRFDAIIGVENVISLTDIMDFRASEDTVEVVKLVEPDAIPTDAAALAELRRYTLSKDLYRGGFVSEDAKATLVVVNLSEKADNEAVAREIMAEGDRIVGDRGRVFFAGFPLTVVAVNDLVVSDMTWLTPGVALVILLILFLMFRTLRGVILPLGTVALATIWSVGLSAWLGYPITMVTGIMPVVLLAVGSAYGIHLLSRYNEDAASGASPRDVVRRAVRRVAWPIAATGVTTFIGFLTLGTATMTIIKHFGVLTAIGVLLGLVAAVTVLPAILTLLPVKSGRERTVEAGGGVADRLLARLGALVVRRPWAIVLGSLAAVVVMALFIPGIRTDVNQLAYFPPESAPRRSEELLQNRFGGSNPVFLELWGDLKDPLAMKLAHRIEHSLRATPHVSRVQSLAGIIADLNHVMNGQRRVPDTKDEVGNLWFFVDGQEMLEQMVTGDLRHGVIQGRIDSHDTGIMEALGDRIATLIETLPVRSRPVAPKDLDPGARAEAREWRADWVTEGVALAVQFRLGRPVGDEARSRIRAAIATQLEVGDQAKISPAELQALSKEVQAYVGGEAFDVELNQEQQQVLVAAVARLVGAGEVGREALTGAVAATLEGSEAASDAEGIELAGESLEAFVAEERERVVVAGLLERVLAEVGDSGSDARTDKELRTDIEAELWEVSSPTWYLPGEPGDEPVLRVEQTGMHLIMVRLNQALIKNQFESMGLALVLVFFLMILQFRSLAVGLLAMLPIGIATVVAFGIMGLADIRLDMATAMIASVTIGIGIDYTIHFLSRLRRELTASADTATAITRTLATTGRAILVNTLAVSLGFLVLVFAGMVPLRHFGDLIALNMVLCAFGALTLMPAVVVLVDARLFRGRKAPSAKQEVLP